MKKHHTFTIIIGAVAIAFLIYKILPDERRILKKNIYALKRAVEMEDKNSVLNYLDKVYLDNHNANYDEIIANLGEFLNSVDSIDIMISGLKIKIDSVSYDKIIYASCSLGLRVSARYENEPVLVFGGIIQPASVKGYFRKGEKVYKLYSASY